jgi:hypothetical protein
MCVKNNNNDNKDRQIWREREREREREIPHPPTPPINPPKIIIHASLSWSISREEPGVVRERRMVDGETRWVRRTPHLTEI